MTTKTNTGGRITSSALHFESTELFWLFPDKSEWRKQRELMGCFCPDRRFFYEFKDSVLLRTQINILLFMDPGTNLAYWKRRHSASKNESGRHSGFYASFCFEIHTQRRQPRKCKIWLNKSSPGCLWLCIWSLWWAPDKETNARLR